MKIIREDSIKRTLSIICHSKTRNMYK